MRRQVVMPVLSSLFLMAAAVPAMAINQPGDPCSTNGASEQLGSGSIQCTNGTWQPTTGPGGLTPIGGVTPSTGTSSVKALKGWTSIGTALTPSAFISSKEQVADASAIRLPNGKVKLFVFVADEGTRSATSTNSGGNAFVAGEAKPIPWAMAGQPRVVSLGGNSMRLFYLSGGNINAAQSTDGGATFTDEGPVITTAQAGFEPGGLSVIRHRGAYRGYFSNLEKPGEIAPRVIRTATSPDMLTWTMGPIITQESGSITDGGSHPFALVDKKGRVGLYYSGDRGSYYGIIVSTSKDGVRFDKGRSVLSGGGDGDILPTGKKGGLMYYGADLGGGQGFGIKVAKTSGPLVP